MNKTQPVIFGFLLSAFIHAVYALFDTVSKGVMARYSVYEVLFFEFLAAALFAFAFFALRRGKHILQDLKINDWKIVLGIGVFRLLGQLIVFVALVHVTMADFYVGIFTIPLMVALLSVVMLKNKLSKALLLSIAICFGGVLVAMQPSTNMNWWIGVVLAGSFFLALLIVNMKKATETESDVALSVYPILFSAIGMGAIMLFDFKMPTDEDMLSLILAGCLMGLANALYPIALRLAPAPYVSGAQYLQLIYGAVAGYFFFGEVPAHTTYIGGAIVIAANIYLMVIEMRKKV